MSILQHGRTAAFVLTALTILTGGVYPLFVTALAQSICPNLANGSLIQQGEAVVGSELIGQPFARPEYFWGRLSATAPFSYNAAASAGSNFGPRHPGLKEAFEVRASALRAAGLPKENIPVDLVTASASGLDPHISPAAAEFQVPRVAASRRMSEVEVREIVRRCTMGRQLAVLGEPRVHVLRLNLALDQHKLK